MEPTFLSLADVLGVHIDQMERYGGRIGIRDLGLLRSALAMPRASFNGEWLHRDPYEMAAAYTFHVAQNQPFFDGNKRTGLACALVFLELNGVWLEDQKGRLHEAMTGIASSNLDKLGLAEVLRALHRES